MTCIAFGKVFDFNNIHLSFFFEKGGDFCSGIINGMKGVEKNRALVKDRIKSSKGINFLTSGIGPMGLDFALLIPNKTMLNSEKRDLEEAFLA